MVTKKNEIRRPSHSSNKEEIIKAVQNASVSRSGECISVPEGMDLEVAIQTLRLKQKEEEEDVNLVFDYDLTVPEGAIALYNTLNELYGFVNSMGTPGFFGDRPPTLLNVKISRTEEVSIPWGRFAVPGIEGTINTGINWKGGVPYFQLTATVPGKYKRDIQKINDVILSRNDSVYRGTCIALSFPNPSESPLQDFFPRFMDVADLKPSDLIFSKDVEDLINVSLFTPITKSEMCRVHGIPLKRGILLEGPYGVGKTLTASVAAALAEKNGWTFIYLGRVADLAKAYSFARHHQPAVIFCEDLDEVLRGEDDRDEAVDAILNSLDGIESKGVEIITVFTTNDVDGITKAMLRPGRIDTVVPVRAPDAEAAARLVHHFAKDKLADGQDLTKVSHLLTGKNAAVVREVVERSKLAAISRLTEQDSVLTITAHDLELAALGMDAHSKLLEDEHKDDRSDLEKAAGIVAEALRKSEAPATQRTGVVRRESTNGHTQAATPAE